MSGLHEVAELIGDADSGPEQAEHRTIVARAVGISKRYGATQALDNVSIDVRVGEIHGLVGRNGCGKSTLVGVLSGVVQQDAGQVFFDSCPAPGFYERSDWAQHVACVYQKPTVVPTLSIAENIFLGNLPHTKRGRVRWNELWRRAEALMGEWGIDVDVRADVSVLGPDERQVVEIIRALLLGTRFVILDEPTAGLQSGEVERLFERIRALRRAGVAFLYISHHLDELFALSQRATILRDGKWIATIDTDSITKDDLISLMVGEEGAVGAASGSAACLADKSMAPVLEVEGLTMGNHCRGVSFSVCAGECVGLAGHTGSGSSQVGDCIAGLLPYQQGEIRIRSRRLAPGRPDKAITAGLGYVPEDRYTQGFVHCMSILDNITLPVMNRLGRWGLISPRKQGRLADELIASMGVKLDSPRQEMTQLSGGNQQKVTVGRALSSEPDVLVLAHPTAGIDVASKATILGAVREVQEQGTAVLLVSDDEQDLRICDRVLVMCNGEVFREFQAGWDEKELVAALEGWGLSGA